MKISEIYHCFSGEGGTVGRRCVLVRAWGCPLRCSFCDSVYAYEGEHTEMSIDEIVVQVCEYNCNFVLLTGGSPLMQPDACYDLVRKLQNRSIDVLVEASGACAISPVVGLPLVHVDLDVKMPSSGHAAINESAIQQQNLISLCGSDEIKFVISDREDYEYAVDFMKGKSVFRYVPTYFSPVWGGGKEFFQQLQLWMMGDRLNVCFSLQQHKCVWPPSKRGV